MYAIVITTINVPRVVGDMVDNLIRYNHSDVEFVIVGDRKTPHQAYSYLADVAKKNPFKVHLLDIGKQEEWLKAHAGFISFMPYDCVERRNIGYLYAAALGADTIISMDDDNFPLDSQDFLAGHSVVSKEIECDCVLSSCGWFNVCDFTLLDIEIGVYHRGFPVSKRWCGNTDTFGRGRRRIGVNAGLWLGDPDVDTLTRIALPPSRVRRIDIQDKLVSDSLTVFNSQNTAFNAKYLPFAFLVTFSSGLGVLAGNNSFRFDDIWMSIFMQTALSHLGESVCFGTPIVRQDRNVHNPLLDLKREMVGLEMTDKLVTQLRGFGGFRNTSMLDMYRELIEFLQTNQSEFDSAERGYLDNMLFGMGLWAKTVGGIL